MTTIADRSSLEDRGESRPSGAVHSLWRRTVLGRMSAIREGRLVVRDADSVDRFGRAAEDGLEAEIVVHSAELYRRLALGGSLGAAEAYVDGLWDSPDLTAVVRVLARNRTALESLDGPTARLRRIGAQLLHRVRRNSRSGSRRNIMAHYDLGNELFSRFLDSSMTYSSAYFEGGDLTLEAAQKAKLDRLCRKLLLGPNDHLLEVGTGWGSLAIHAASTYGCRVTTTTISPSQLTEAKRRVREAGLEDRIELLHQDYRDLDGCFDKVASVEMIEAVGLDNLPRYFGTLGRLVRPDGLVGLQAITIADRNFESARGSVDFIQRYIFPGGALPSVGAMAASVATTPLTMVHLEEIGLHYAETLGRWRRRFEASWHEISKLGYDERFRRLWRYYLEYCEGGFRERVISACQVVLAGPAFRDDTVREL